MLKCFVNRVFVIFVLPFLGGAIVIGRESIVYHDGSTYVAVAPPIFKVCFIRSKMFTEFFNDFFLAKCYCLLCSSRQQRIALFAWKYAWTTVYVVFGS